MDRALAEELLAMAAEDLRVRERLAADGSLFQGYHPQMRAVHERHADRLTGIIAERGWPEPGLVGEEAAHAAWLVAQHAISRPALMRQALAMLVETSGAPNPQTAQLEDRIRLFEGREQRFGTQFDWDERGEINPCPIEEQDKVDWYRAEAGLPPLAQAIAEHRARSGSKPGPTDLAARRRAAEAFAGEVGWR
jgi:hypothetical protein